MKRLNWRIDCLFLDAKEAKLYRFETRGINLYTLTDEILEDPNVKRYPVVIFCDLSKTFNCVGRGILLEKN